MDANCFFTKTFRQLMNKAVALQARTVDPPLLTG